MNEKYLVRHGGLMRCCIATLDEAMVAAEKPPEEGDKLTCKYCHEEYGMVFRDGAWEWATPR